MATGLANSTSLPTPPPRAEARPPQADEQVIHRQLGRAGSHVKWIEAGSQLLTLLIGTLVFFLLAALVDHWIMPLGWLGRWTLLIGYLAGCAWFLATRVVPIVIRAVNPAYSARVIEEATPSLKNSLINFLFLKQDQAGVKQAVLDAMQHRAAADISTIEVDTAIDRTPLIRLGYVMCGVMAVVALYKIASPKDPFQTVARVVAPWADLARPSRVVIHEVTPGHTSVYLGSQVEVTADVQGVRGNDEVRLIYSTADGQVVDRAIVMKAAEGGRRYSATLPAADDSTEASASRRPAGLQQGVQYHIEAGDALSSIYEIRVRMAPTIAVEKADLNFAPYTRRPMQTQETGEISALEGTRVTIHARANQPIKSAFLEFDPRPGSAAETLPLTVDGQDATGTFVLQLKPDRVTPWRESYQVRFINDQGEVSEQPVIHKLQVQADLPPEVQILAPVQSRVDVAEDGQLTIEVRGVDPDFALTRLLVTGKTKDKPQFEQSLLPPGDLPSQATGKYEFRPSQLGLKAGTVVLVHGAAVDNRHDPLTGQPQPGRAQTSELTINIVPARKPNGQNGQAGANQPQQNQADPNQPNENQPQDGAQNKQPPMNGQKSGEEQKPGENQPGENKSGEQKPDQKQDGQQSQKKDEQQPQDGQQSGSGSGQGSSSQGGEGQGSSGQPNKGQNSKPMEGQNSQGGSGQNQQPMPGQEQPNQDQAGNEGANNGSSQQQPGGGNSGMGTSQSADPMNQQTSEGQGGAPGSRNDQQPGANNAGSEQNEGGQGTGQAGGPQGRQGSGANQKPEHDGQKFEELLKHLREKAQQPKQGSEGQEVGSQQKQAGDNSQPNGADQQPGNNSTKGGQPQPMQPGSQQPKEQPGAKGNDNRDVTAEELDQLAKQMGEKNGEPNANSQQQKPGGGQPAPMPGQNAQSGNQNGQAPQQGGKQPGSPQNGENQKRNDGQSGSPQGPPPQGEGDKPTPAEGEQKKPGAGQNGDSGAGSQSKDPTGSGQGQEQNRDVKKDMQSGNQQAESSDPSAPSTSKKQSDSKGGASGDQSGGGKQGAGQSGGQQGNDSAGGSSPGDEGAGAAKEQGKGETGSKGGAGQEAAGKTGVSGNKPGQGTETKAGSKGSEPGTDNPQGNQPKDKRGSQPGGSKAGGSDVGPGNPTGGGTAADRTGQGITNRSEDVADAANEAYTRKATDLVLQHLREQEHNPDPELAKRLQLTPQELQEFARRWNQLKKDAEADPNKARELDEAFRSLGLRDPKTKRRLGGTVSDKQRDLRDTGGRTQAPSKYRQQFDQFRKATGN